MADYAIGNKTGIPVQWPTISSPTVTQITLANMGTSTFTTSRLIWNQEGHYLNGHYEFINATGAGATSATMVLPLPPGLTVNESFLSNAGNIAIGQGEFLTSTPRYDCIVYYSSGVGIIVRFDNGADLQTILNSDLAIAGRRLVADIRVPITEFTSTALQNYGSVASTSSGSGGLAPVLIAVNTAAVTNKMYCINTAGGQVTLTLPSGTTEASVGALDANETFTANKAIVAPPSGQSIGTGAVDETWELDFSKGWAVFYRPANTTVWRVQYQMTGSGGSGTGLTSVETTTDVNPAVSGNMYAYGTLAAARTLTLPTGTSGFVIGVVGSASTSFYLDVVPGAGNTINGAADTDRYRYPNFYALYFRAEGSTNVQVARQSATLTPNATATSPGLVSRESVYSGSSTTLGYVAASGINGNTFSNGSLWLQRTGSGYHININVVMQVGIASSRTAGTWSVTGFTWPAGTPALGTIITGGTIQNSAGQLFPVGATITMNSSSLTVRFDFVYPAGSAAPSDSTLGVNFFVPVV